MMGMCSEKFVAKRFLCANIRVDAVAYCTPRLWCTTDAHVACPRPKCHMRRMIVLQAQFSSL